MRVVVGSRGTSQSADAGGILVAFGVVTTFQISPSQIFMVADEARPIIDFLFISLGGLLDFQIRYVSTLHPELFCLKNFVIRYRRV